MKIEFNLQNPAIIHLASSDHLLSNLINRIGCYTLELDNDYYLKLVKSIIGQQLSIKAKETIWNRVANILGNNITPQNIIKTDDSLLRNAGVSYAKIAYIKELSEMVFSKSVDLETLNSLSNEDVVKSLTSVKGIGKWTAEMFLIFSLGKLDIFSLNDAGLRRAIKWLYCFRNTPETVELIRISERWKPYRSVASLYLWEIINTGLINDNPNILKTCCTTNL